MCAKNKLKKFAQLDTFSNVFQCEDFRNPVLTTSDGSHISPGGTWASNIFKNKNPITLEIACGRGEYTLGLAAQNTDTNYIGIDIKGARIWKGASIAIENNYNHVAFVRTRIEMLEHFFAVGEIDTIWITFPDPFLRERNKGRRLTGLHFLDLYAKLLKPGGTVNLKTDNPFLYEFSLESMSQSDKGRITFHHSNIYTMDFIPSDLEIKTYYENMHLADNRSIRFISFQMHG